MRNTIITTMRKSMLTSTGSAAAMTTIMTMTITITMRMRCSRAGDGRRSINLRRRR